jgi:hypothetical protein
VISLRSIGIGHKQGRRQGRNLRQSKAVAAVRFAVQASYGFQSFSFFVLVFFLSMGRRRERLRFRERAGSAFLGWRLLRSRAAGLFVGISRWLHLGFIGRRDIGQA